MKPKLIFLILALNISWTHAQNDEGKIEQILSSFVSDLNNLNLDPFIDAFDEKATIFFPRNSFPIKRVEGKENIRSEFETFFSNVRGDKTEGPYLNIEPQDRVIDVYGNTAIVSLHFILGEELHRRTIVLQKTNSQWLISHIHASFLTK